MIQPTQTVLVIENETTLLEMYRIKFSTSGLNFIGASTGEEGLKLLEQQPIDLLLVDLMLQNKATGGVIDGYEVIKQVRKKNKDIKICALTNLDQEKNIKQAFEAGADDYLVKSDLTPAELVAKAKDVLEGKEVGPSKNNRKFFK